MEVPESVQKCVAIFKSAESDTEKFAGLFMVTKLTKGDECSSEVKKVLFEAVGVEYLKRLLTCSSLSECPPQVYKSVALSVFSSFCKDIELSRHPDILKSIPLFFEIVQQADNDDFDDNLMIISEAYECLRYISSTTEGRKALLDEGAVSKIVDIYSQQTFQADEALKILVTIVQNFGRAAWKDENPKHFNSLMNKVALDFETDHSERKFELAATIQSLLLSCDKEAVCDSLSEESWPLFIYKGLNDILTSKIGKLQRDPALKLASVTLGLLGVEWASSDEEKPKFLLLLIHLCSIEVRMQLEDKGFGDILKNSELIISCFIVLELALGYIANDVLYLEQKEKQQLYMGLKGAFSAVMAALTKVEKSYKDKPYKDENEKIFVCAMVRALSAWLARETIDKRNTVYQLLPFMLNICNETFYAFRSRYVEEKVKSTSREHVGNSTILVDILRLMLPALCHLTIEDKARKIMLDCKQDAVLLESFTFHWSIVNYKKPPVPKSERLKVIKAPEPQLSSQLLNDMKNSRAAMISLCNIFMNLVVLEPAITEESSVFSGLLKFILNNLTELKNIPDNLVLHGNMAVLGLLLLKQQSKKVKKNDFSICRYIQTTIRFLWDAYNVDESNDSTTLVVSMSYKMYWIELMELWFLGMQTMSSLLALIPWISEFAIETGWAQGIVDTLKKVRVGSLSSNVRSAYEDFLCHLVDTNENVIPVLKEHDVLTVCRNHLFMQLGKKIFGD